MSSRSDEERLYSDHLQSLGRLLELPAAQQAERDAVARDAAAPLDAALAAERDAKDRVAAARQNLEGAQSQVARLVARSGAIATPDDRALPERLADVERASASLLADLRSAESAWSWVERAQTAPLSTPAAAPIAPQSAPTVPVPAPETGSSRRVVLIAAVVAILVLFFAIVAIFLL